MTSPTTTISVGGKDFIVTQMGSSLSVSLVSPTLRAGIDWMLTVNPQTPMVGLTASSIRGTDERSTTTIERVEVMGSGCSGGSGGRTFDTTTMNRWPERTPGGRYLNISPNVTNSFRDIADTVLETPYLFYSEGRADPRRMAQAILRAEQRAALSAFRK